MQTKSNGAESRCERQCGNGNDFIENRHLNSYRIFRSLEFQCWSCRLVASGKEYGRKKRLHVGSSRLRKMLFSSLCRLFIRISFSWPVAMSAIVSVFVGLLILLSRYLNGREGTTRIGHICKKDWNGKTHTETSAKLVMLNLIENNRRKDFTNTNGKNNAQEILQLFVHQVGLPAHAMFWKICFHLSCER